MPAANSWCRWRSGWRGIVAVVVAFSVVVQGSLTPAAAQLLHVPMRVMEPEPWALGLRLREEPNGVHRLTIRPCSPADESRSAVRAYHLGGKGVRGSSGPRAG